MKLPANQIWTQANEGDIAGTLYSSFNIDLLSRKKKLMISPRFMSTSLKSALTNMKVPFAFKKSDLNGNNFWYCGSGDRLFVGGITPDIAFTETPSGATLSPRFENIVLPDLEVFQDVLYLTDGKLKKQSTDGATYSEIGTNLLSSSLSGLLRAFAGRLYFMSDYNKIGSVDSGGTPVVSSGTPNINVYAMNIVESPNNITCLTANSDNIWIGTLNNEEGAGYTKIYKWDGISTAAPKGYKVFARTICAMTVLYDTPYALDSNGILSAFNGGTFKEVARLPFKNGKKLKGSENNDLTRIVNYNGMITDGDNILILVNGNYADGTQEENIQSGLWIYNETNGLYHAGSLSTWAYGVTTTAQDYGQSKVTKVGAIAKANNSSTTAEGSLLLGCQINSADSAGVYIDNFFDTKEKAGYIITSKIYSNDIQDTFNQIIPRFRRFLNAGDKMVVKYRTFENEHGEASIIWSNDGNIFTTAQTGLSVGDEVEILQGIGGGICAHITNIETVGSNYVITIDETAVGMVAGDIAVARFQNFIKVGSYSSQGDDFKIFTPLQKNTSTWIQVKIWFKWTGSNELYDILINNGKHQ